MLFVLHVHVVPLAGTWIETGVGDVSFCCVSQSFPSRERGLKQSLEAQIEELRKVVPLAGTWIETLRLFTAFVTSVRSFPSRERGLKHRMQSFSGFKITVVPLAGTWIETDLT